MASSETPADLTVLIHDYKPLDDSDSIRPHRVPRHIVMCIVASTCLCGVMLFAWSAAKDSADIGSRATDLTGIVSNSMLCRSGNLQVRWMWGDASIVGHLAAQYDPLRWSSWKSIPDTIGDFEKVYSKESRPVEIETTGCGDTVTKKYGDVAQTIENLLESLESLLCPSANLEMRWMWGDASIIGHWAAELDPLRWSSWESGPDAIGNWTTFYHNGSRPVEVEMRGCGGRARRTYVNATDAVQHLDGGLASMLCLYPNLFETRWKWYHGSTVQNYVSEWNPWSWSAWNHTSSVLGELNEYENKSKPIEVELRGCGIEFMTAYDGVNVAKHTLGAYVQER